MSRRFQVSKGGRSRFAATLPFSVSGAIMSGTSGKEKPRGSTQPRGIDRGSEVPTAPLFYWIARAPSIPR